MIKIDEGRHPEVENQVDNFITNNVELGSGRQMLALLALIWAGKRLICYRLR